MTQPAAVIASPLSGPELGKLQQFLSQALLRGIESEGVAPEKRRDFVNQHLERVYEQAHVTLPEDTRRTLLQSVLDDLLGYGPIQPLLDDPEVTEVMVNGAHQIYVEKNGQLIRTDVSFNDDAHVLRIIDRIILPLGRRVDHDSPTVDARLPDGSRVNAVVPPVALDGPSITIRKFPKDRLQIAQLIEYGSVTQHAVDFLRACVLARLNIVVSGGTGSGKTTLLNALSGFIPANERILTIEDTAELQLQQDHVLRLEAQAAKLGRR